MVLLDSMIKRHKRPYDTRPGAGRHRPAPGRRMVTSLAGYIAKPWERRLERVRLYEQLEARHAARMKRMSILDDEKIARLERPAPVWPYSTMEVLCG